MASTFRPWSLGMLLVAVALAGCVGGNDAAEPQAAEPTQTQEPEPVVNETQAPEPVNTAPTANLTADLTNGSAPLNVTFTVLLHDDEGDNLTWTLDADGDGTADANGTQENTTALFSYASEGNYTAVLEVSDGEFTVNATLLIEVAAAIVEEVGDGMCHRPNAIAIDHYWWDDRYPNGGVPGTGLILGGGTWIYEESNGVPGLQIGGPEEAAAYRNCQNPDTLIF